MLEPIPKEFLQHGQKVILKLHGMWFKDEVRSSTGMYSNMVSLVNNGAIFDMEIYADTPITRTYLLLKKIKLTEQE